MEVPPTGPLTVPAKAIAWLYDVQSVVAHTGEGEISPVLGLGPDVRVRDSARRRRRRRRDRSLTDFRGRRGGDCGQRDRRSRRGWWRPRRRRGRPHRGGRGGSAGGRRRGKRHEPSYRLRCETGPSRTTCGPPCRVLMYLRIKSASRCPEGCPQSGHSPRASRPVGPSSRPLEPTTGPGPRHTGHAATPEAGTGSTGAGAGASNRVGAGASSTTSSGAVGLAARASALAAIAFAAAPRRGQLSGAAASSSPGRSYRASSRPIGSNTTTPCVDGSSHHSDARIAAPSGSRKLRHSTRPLSVNRAALLRLIAPPCGR